MPATYVSIRPLAPSELGRAEEIDVTEEGAEIFVQTGADISTRRQAHARPARTAAEWYEFVERWAAILADGGSAIAAFDRDRVVGIAVLRRDLEPGVAQLDSLFVDRAHRRLGVATTLTAEVERLARLAGASELYVSATPSESAVGFYRSLDFVPTDRLNATLFALEPEDIHMRKPL